MQERRDAAPRRNRERGLPELTQPTATPAPRWKPGGPPFPVAQQDPAPRDEPPPSPCARRSLTSAPSGIRRIRQHPSPESSPTVRQSLQIGVNHHANQLSECHRRRPVQFF